MKDLSNEDVVHVVSNGFEFLQFRRLLEYKDIINHAYSVGLNTNFRTAKANKELLSDQEYENAINDYKGLCNAINEDYIKTVKTNQDHTNNIKIVGNKVNDDSPDFNLHEYDRTDGLITNKSDIILSTTNADCILLLFFDPVKRVIANVHSGWKGTLQRISVVAIKKMIDEYGCNPKDIICCICPSIRKCHFEVDKDVKEQFYNEFKDLNEIDDIIEQTSDNKWNIDTVLINKVILEDLGLKQNNIIDSGLCSVCNCDKIHSFRVEKDGYGLATALIKLC